MACACSLQRTESNDYAFAESARLSTQAAELKVHRGEDWPWIDIHTDDYADSPFAELRRLLAVVAERASTSSRSSPRANFPAPPRPCRDQRRYQGRRGAPGESRRCQRSFATALA
jgi:hypothetical protein